MKLLTGMIGVKFSSCDSTPVFIVIGFSLIIEMMGVLPTRTDEIVHY